MYEEVFPNCWTRFQDSPGSPNRHVVDIGTPPGSSSWRHDAESAFWLLLWWVVNVTPAGSDPTEIPIGLWAPLVGTKIDARSPKLSATSLDPAYAPLTELLNQLGGALESNLRWATMTPYTHPDFLREVFQCRISNFIFDNQEKEFTKLVKADASRQPEEFFIF